MANDTAVDQQQLQSTIDELYRKLTDALKAQLGTINVGENQALGLLSTADDLATAPVGDQAALRTAIGLGSVATEKVLPVAKGGTGAESAGTARNNLGLGSISTFNTTADGAHWGKAPYVRGDGVMQVGRYLDFFITSEATNNYDVRITATSDGKLTLNGNELLTLSSFMGLGAAGGVGTIAYLRTAITVGYGQLVGSTNLFYSSSVANQGANPQGTWRCHGSCAAGNATVFQRLA